jgi:TRAP-type C4-dicarboxylate transport system substrate-binding protein
MKVTTKRPLVAVLVAALVAGAPAGCGFGSGGDKAGGSRAPVVLRLAVAYAADQPDAPAARDFASRVAELSGGSLRVRVVFDAAGHKIANPEGRVARMVRDGEFELGWIGARAWDGQGITSFQALQAPFLVTSQALLDRIATGPLASRMLAGLQGHGFVGLALVPDRLRHPIGVERPLASPADFAGARVRAIPSRATDALLRALGATPVHVGNDDVHTAMSNRKIDGSEVSLGGSFAGGRYLTANVTLFAKALTLFAGQRAYERLDDDQRTVIRRSAQQTVAHVAAHPPSDSALVRRFCEAGRVVMATKADTAALQRAAEPVFTRLQRDPRTKELIAGIRELKARTPATPAPVVPASCSQPISPAEGERRQPGPLNGTYRWLVTKAGVRAVGGLRDESQIGTVSQMTLRDGKWLLGPAGRVDPDGGDTGTYEITANRIVFDWPATGSTLTFTFKRHANGTLDLKPVLPMDRGDRGVWAGGPWRRAGPPVGIP